MTVKRNVLEIVLLAVYLAAVFTLVRPGSQGPVLVGNIGDAVSGLISAAVGTGGWSQAPSSGPGVLYA